MGSGSIGFGWLGAQRAGAVLHRRQPRAGVAGGPPRRDVPAGRAARPVRDRLFVPRGQQLHRLRHQPPGGGSVGRRPFVVRTSFRLDVLTVRRSRAWRLQRASSIAAIGESPAVSDLRARNRDVSSDGEHFLFVVDRHPERASQDGPEVEIVVNWFTELLALSGN
jgi:hypothetical protein